MEQEIGFKELYDVALKATYPIEISGREIEQGETVALFDKIQLANFQEVKSLASANGGFDNRGHVFWETTKEIKLNLVQGVFSKTMLSLMTNAKLVSNLDEEILINKIEQFESDENGKITIGRTLRGPVFLYDKDGAKIPFAAEYEGQDFLQIDEPYKTVTVDYWFLYNDGGVTLRVGTPLTSGFLSLTGKMRVKDDITGHIKTGIINIPKLKLMSDLSMRLGGDATPIVGRLDAVAVPTGVRGQQRVMDILFLNDDIDADM